MPLPIVTKDPHYKFPNDRADLRSYYPDCLEIVSFGPAGDELHLVFCQDSIIFVANDKRSAKLSNILATIEGIWFNDESLKKLFIERIRQDAYSTQSEQSAQYHIEEDAKRMGLLIARDFNRKNTDGNFKRSFFHPPSFGHPRGVEYLTHVFLDPEGIYIAIDLADRGKIFEGYPYGRLLAKAFKCTVLLQNFEDIRLPNKAALLEAAIAEFEHSKQAIESHRQNYVGPNKSLIDELNFNSGDAYLKLAEYFSKTPQQCDKYLALAKSNACQDFFKLASYNLEFLALDKNTNSNSREQTAYECFRQAIQKGQALAVYEYLETIADLHESKPLQFLACRNVVLDLMDTTFNQDKEIIRKTIKLAFQYYKDCSPTQLLKVYEKIPPELRKLKYLEEYIRFKSTKRLNFNFNPASTTHAESIAYCLAAYPYAEDKDTVGRLIWKLTGKFLGEKLPAYDAATLQTTIANFFPSIKDNAIDTQQHDYCEVLKENKAQIFAIITGKHSIDSQTLPALLF